MESLNELEDQRLAYMKALKSVERKIIAIKKVCKHENREWRGCNLTDNTNRYACYDCNCMIEIKDGVVISQVEETAKMTEVGLVYTTREIMDKDQQEKNKLPNG